MLFSMIKICSYFKKYVLSPKKEFIPLNEQFIYSLSLSFKKILLIKKY